MRLGHSKIGGARFGEPDATTLVAYDDYQDDPASYPDARLPYDGGEDVATVALYPGLGGRETSETIVRKESSGHYDIRLEPAYLAFVGGQIVPAYGMLPYWRSASWRQTLNEADSLTFEYPANAIYAADLKRPNVVSVFNECGELVQRLRLTDIIPTVRRDGNGVFVNAVARGFLSQFEEEWVTYYGPVRKVVTDIIDEFMAYYATVPSANLTYPGMTGASEQYAAGVLINVAIQLQAMYDKLWTWSNAYTLGDNTHADIQTAIAAQHAGAWPVYDDSNPAVTPWPTIAPSAWSHLWDIRASIADHNDTGYTIPEHVANLLGEFQAASQRIACGEVFNPFAGWATLNADISDSGETIVLTADPGSIMATANFGIRITDELIWVVSRTAATLTCTGGRGYRGTTAVAHTAGDRVNFVSLVDQNIKVTFESKPLMDCIRELFNLSGQKGQYTVTPAREFVWKERLGSSAAIPLALGYNLQSLERRHDASEYATKLYVYGAGMSEATRIVAVRTSGSAPYIVRRVTVDAVTDQTSLDAYADELITVVSTPALEYSVNALDLASIGVGAPMTIGSLTLTTDVDLGISAYIDVYSIQKSLDSPLPISYTLARRKKTLATLLKSLSDRIAKIEQRDDTTRIEEAVASGEITGVARVDAAVTAGTERNGDFKIDPETGRLSYVDLTTGALLWQESPRINPNAASRQPGDFNLAATIEAAVAAEVADALSYVNTAGDVVPVPNAYNPAVPAMLPAASVASPVSLGVIPGDGLYRIDTLASEIEAIWTKLADLHEALSSTDLGTVVGTAGLAIALDGDNAGLNFTYGAVHKVRLAYFIMTGGIDEGREVVLLPDALRAPLQGTNSCTLTFSESAPPIPVEVPEILSVTVYHNGGEYKYVPGNGEVSYPDLTLYNPSLKETGYFTFNVISLYPGMVPISDLRYLYLENETVAFEGWIELKITQVPKWFKAGGSQFAIAATKALLDAKIAAENLTPPKWGYVTDTGRYYDLSGWGAWQCINYLE